MADMTTVAAELGSLTLAAGALGTAAFGIVDALKWLPRVDSAGFGALFAAGDGSAAREKGALNPLVPALTLAYGTAALDVLRAEFRAADTGRELPRMLR